MNSSYLTNSSDHQVTDPNDNSLLDNQPLTVGASKSEFVTWSKLITVSSTIDHLMYKSDYDWLYQQCHKPCKELLNM